MNFSAVDDFQQWLHQLARVSTLLELGALLLCALLAWASVWGLRRRLGPGVQWPVWLGQRGVDGVMFPLAWLALAYLARLALAQVVPNAVFRIAIPVLVALAVIRVGVKVLQVAFSEAALVRSLERSISWLAWGALVLWVSGLLPLLLESLEQIHWKIGNSPMSVRTLIEGVVTAGAVLILSLWVSSMIEARLLRSATGGELSVRKAISNATRALLMFVGLMLALSAVGIDLTALSVLGGAVGVGIGFGLQKLAANYVSGFVILAERSMRIGDSVRVDGFEGSVTDIRARYTVIRSQQGRESIVPNEMLMTARVENLSLADTRLWLSTTLTVGYDSDVALVMRLLCEAASAQPRVLKDPAPSAALSAFGADGLEFTLGFWLADPENGQLNLRSDVNVAVLLALRQHGIEIPYPQRVVHTRSA